VGAAREKAIVVNGELEISQVMTVTLSADHRAVDGALEAEWMVAFKKAIENPLMLVVGAGHSCGRLAALSQSQITALCVHRSGRQNDGHCGC
jgi:hypothetical protein